MTTSFVTASDHGDTIRAVRSHISRPAYLLKRSEQTLTSLYLEQSRTARSRLTFSQLLLLCAIDAAPGAHQAVVAGMAGIDKPTTTVVLRSLIRKGLVNREISHQDRRHRILTATSAGRAVRKASLGYLAAAQEIFLEPVNKRDRQKLLKLLIIISGNPHACPPPLGDRDGQLITTPDYLPHEVLVAFFISRCLQVAVSLVTPALTPFGLSIGQYVSLFVLTTFAECNLATLGRALGRDRSSLALILSSLEARSLVSINQQRRSLRIAATQAGLELFLKARPSAEQANTQILSDLKRSDAQDFAQILKRTLDHHGKLMISNVETRD